MSGVDVTIDWASIEPADGVWDWTATDASFEAAINMGYFLETSLQVGAYNMRGRSNAKNFLHL